MHDTHSLVVSRDPGARTSWPRAAELRTRRRRGANRTGRDPEDFRFALPFALEWGRGGRRLDTELNLHVDRQSGGERQAQLRSADVAGQRDAGDRRSAEPEPFA